MDLLPVCDGWVDALAGGTNCLERPAFWTEGQQC